MGIENHIQDATQSTPFALVYEVEVVLSLELQIPSHHIAIQEGLTAYENHKLHLTELKPLDEKRQCNKKHSSWRSTTRDKNTNYHPAQD